MRGRALSCGLTVLLLLGVGSARAEGVEPGPDDALELPTHEEIEDAVPEGATLTGRQIYERYLDNRQIHAAFQHQKLISTDPGGSTQTSRFWVRWKDYTDHDDKPVDGIYAKTLVRFTEPFDMRNTGFLMIAKEGGKSDQFIYRPSDRRVRRVNMSSGSLMGSDYSFDDIAFHNLEDAEYTRHADEELDGGPVYVVEAIAKPTAHSKYHRTLSYIEREHYVALKVRYWDGDGVEVKLLTAPRSSIKSFDGIWVATYSTMHNLQEDTTSEMIVEDLEPNPELTDRLFSLFKLSIGR